MGLGLSAAVSGGTEAAEAASGTSEAGKDFGDLVMEGVRAMPQIAEGAAILLVSCLVVIALMMLAVTMSKRVLRASLVVRPFIDGAVDAKIGAGMASMVEERLVGALRRRELVETGYDLDQVAIDIELLAEDNDLSKAMERLADVPQFKLVVAVMDLMERLLPARGLAAAGELLPAGRDGAGVSLALYQGNRLTARSSLWEDEVSLWLPGGSGRASPSRRAEARKQAAETKDAQPAEGAALDPSPHYGLAAPAAWWVQYEAARVLDQNVSLVTNSAPSFSLVGIGLARERQGRVRAAEDAYASALDHDPDNVAALFNLAQLLAREHALYVPAALLLVRAEESLADRHWQET